MPLRRHVAIDKDIVRQGMVKRHLARRSLSGHARHARQRTTRVTAQGRAHTATASQENGFLSPAESGTSIVAEGHAPASARFTPFLVTHLLPSALRQYVQNSAKMSSHRNFSPLMSLQMLTCRPEAAAICCSCCHVPCSACSTSAARAAPTSANTHSDAIMLPVARTLCCSERAIVGSRKADCSVSTTLYSGLR